MSKIAEMLVAQDKAPEAQTHWQRGKPIAEDGGYRGLLQLVEALDCPSPPAPARSGK